MAEQQTSETESHFGFLTIELVPELGHCGGLLVLNLHGRPVEFHCTSPVVENRARKILYGRTYQPFLYCDQIGVALTARCGQTLALLVTDKPEALMLNRTVDSPVVSITDPSDVESGSFLSEAIHTLTVGTRKLWTTESDSNGHRIAELCSQFQASLSLDEPFERIRLAITEAQTVSR